MKKIVLIFAGIFLLVRCSPGDENNPKFHLELLPVHSSTFPTQFTKDVEYEIPIQFVRPSNCHVFEGFYYDKSLNTRTVAIQSSVLEQGNCIVTPQPPSTQILRFKPTTETSYIFKLWKGVDASGADIYEEITIPVIP